VAAIPIQVKFDQNPFDLRKGGLTNWKFLIAFLKAA
jgi:hypothetical protein